MKGEAFVRGQKKQGIRLVLIFTTLMLFTFSDCLAEDPPYIALKGADGGALIGKFLSQNEAQYMSALVGDMNLRYAYNYGPGTTINIKHMIMSLSYNKDDNAGYITPYNFSYFEYLFPDQDMDLQITGDLSNMWCFSANTQIVAEGLKFLGGAKLGALCYYYEDENGSGWPVTNPDEANKFIYRDAKVSVDGRLVNFSMVGDIVRGDIFMLSK